MKSRGLLLLVLLLLVGCNRRVLEAYNSTPEVIREEVTSETEELLDSQETTTVESVAEVIETISEYEEMDTRTVEDIRNQIFVIKYKDYEIKLVDLFEADNDSFADTVKNLDLWYETSEMYTAEGDLYTGDDCGYAINVLNEVPVYFNDSYVSLGGEITLCFGSELINGEDVRNLSIRLNNSSQNNYQYTIWGYVFTDSDSKAYKLKDIVSGLTLDSVVGSYKVSDSDYIYSLTIDPSKGNLISMGVQQVHQMQDTE